MSIWDDPTTALGRAHNVVTDDELKGLSSIPSHELLNHHIHKLVQVCHFSFDGIFLYLYAYTYAHAQF